MRGLSAPRTLQPRAARRVWLATAVLWRAFASFRPAAVSGSVQNPLMKKSPLRILVLGCLLMASTTLAAPPAAHIQWLGQTPAPAATGVSWGVPWAKGVVPKDQKFALTAPDGRTLPLQTWPLAYWPDGSLKWS